MVAENSVAISLSTRLEREISVISLSRRDTSRKMTFISFCCCSGSEILLIVSAALRSEDSGFLSSWATSAAKPAVAAILCCSSSVMSMSDSDSLPISSRRRGNRFIRVDRSRLRRRLSASEARYVIGPVMERASHTLSAIVISVTMPKSWMKTTLTSAISSSILPPLILTISAPRTRRRS